MPAGAVGALRLRWKGDRPGPKDLAAVLWMGEKGLGPQQRFLIRTVFIGPLRVVPITEHIRIREVPSTVTM